MATTPLKKATRNGFTVLPNKIIDDILKSSGKNVADTLALLIYCVRHIPAQSGTLSLHGNFSQGQICADLGWGPTNKQRLKRACQYLESFGVLDQELRDNNILLLHIKAELENQCSDLKEEGRGDTKNSHPVINIPCGQGVKIPSTPYIENKYKNKSQENLLEQPLIRKPETIDKIAGNQTHDDDLEKLCRLYRDLLKKSITPKHREAFAKTYRENSKPFNLVENAIRTIAKHPKLHKDTVSINAVWQLPFMLRAARQFEANVRELLHNLKMSGVQDLVERVLCAAKESGVDLDIFTAFFGNDICEATTTTRPGDPNSAQNLRQNAPELPHTEFSKTEVQTLPSKTSMPIFAREKTVEESDYGLVIPATKDSKDPISQRQIHLAHPLAESKSEIPKDKAEPKVLPLGAIGKSLHPSVTKRKNGENIANIDIAERLVRAVTKVEFLSLIKVAVETPTLATRDKEIFTALKELTILPNSTLSMLQTSVAQRFRLRKAS